MLVMSFRVDGVISTSFFSSERFGSLSKRLYWWDASKFSAMLDLFNIIALGNGQPHTGTRTFQPKCVVQPCKVRRVGKAQHSLNH